MSEYQYYEFVSIDQPLTPAQQSELRAVSSRAQITASSFVNTYQWGDLRADPQMLMERYFDAFLYLANWGTHRVSLRLPIQLLDPDSAAAYCVGDSVHCRATRTHVLLDLHSDDEDGEWEEDGHGQLPRVAGAWVGCWLPPRDGWAARERAAQQRREAEQSRRERAAAAAREERLQTLAVTEERAWWHVENMIATKKPKEYDAAVVLLEDLKALSERDGQTAAYQQRIRLLREQHARKPSLLDRLEHARLG